MAGIYDVKLEIIVNGGSAVAQVSYTLKGSPADVEYRHTYKEVVELIGVDEYNTGEVEDGQNEPIPCGLVFDGSVTFDTWTIERRRLHPLPVSALDEDSDWFRPNLYFPRRDEIRAMVTLTQVNPPPSTNGISDLVTFGRPRPSTLVLNR